MSRGTRVAVGVMIVSGLIAITLIVLRLVAGSIVRSDDFCEVAAQLVERAIAKILPQPIVSIATCNLTGLITLEMSQVKVMSARDPHAQFVLANVAFTPALTSIFTDTARAHATLSAVEGGAVDMDITASTENLRARSLDGAQVEAQISGLTAKDLGNFVLDGLDFAGVKVLSGSFDGSAVYGDRKGHVRAVLSDFELALAADEAHRAKISSTEVEVTLENGRMTLAAPLALEDADGRATVTGFADMGGSTSLNIGIKIVGAPQFAGALPRILHCEPLPTTPIYQVRGPASKTVCNDLTPDPP